MCGDLYSLTRVLPHPWQLAIPVILLSLIGWILFGIGFGIRNFQYRDVETDNLKHAAHVDFFFMWLFGLGAPVLLILTFIHAFCGNRITLFLIFLFVPAFFVGAGGTMFFDGIQIYQFHQNDKNVVTCTDNQNGFLRVPPIHTGLGDGGYVFVPIEFAGVTTAILSYWVFLLLVPFFASKKNSYDVY